MKLARVISVVVCVSFFCVCRFVNLSGHFFSRRLHILRGIVVVLTLTRIIKSVVTGEAPVSLRNTPEKKHKQPNVIHAYITADAIHASTRNV